MMDQSCRSDRKDPFLIWEKKFVQYGFPFVSTLGGWAVADEVALMLEAKRNVRITGSIAAGIGVGLATFCGIKSRIHRIDESIAR